MGKIVRIEYIKINAGDDNWTINKDIIKDDHDVARIIGEKIENGIKQIDPEKIEVEITYWR